MVPPIVTSMYDYSAVTRNMKDMTFCCIECHFPALRPSVK